MAKDLAQKIGYIYIDSGAMYRATTLYAIQHNLFADGKLLEEKLKSAMDDIQISFNNNLITGKPDTYLNGVNVEDEIRSMPVASKVSEVSALKFVREEMVRQQQAMGKEKGIVMDGRDIGTVVFPGAELKIFVTAKPVIRAERRLLELKGKGNTSITLEEVLENVKRRDYIDQTRKESPLRQAEDALVLDNSELTIDQQRTILLEMFNKILNQ
ncbi:MAG: cmk [Bacteroidetes bacterium]|nr:cmk [Bacteroidota bacterium]